MKFKHMLGWISAGLLLCAAICWIIFKAIGPSVDAAGVLHEPFLLLPMAWLFLFAGIACGAIYLAVCLLRSRNFDSGEQGDLRTPGE